MTAPAAPPDNAPVDPDGLLGDDTTAPADADGAQSAPDGDDAPKDWEAEYKAQQRINRDLERRSKQKMRELEQQLAAAKNTKPADGDDKPDLDAIRKELRAEVTSEALKDKALDKLEAKAARTFQNPDDARAFLAGRVEDFIDDGKVDVDAISDALADLLKERPYLGVTQGDAKRFQGTADGGARGAAGKPQISKVDMQRMYKEGKHAEIEQARLDGRLNDVLGIKSPT